MHQVSFYANTSDDSHCVQAAFRIMLKYFLPDQEFRYSELDRLTEKAGNQGTWWPPGLTSFTKMGLKVRAIEAFDYQQYYEQGQRYVLNHFGPEIGSWYLRHTNILNIKESIPEFLKTVDFECRAATMADIDELLAEGWLVGLELNSRRLHNLDGFVAHMVVIFSAKNGKYFMHDPGLPPRPNLEISASRLEDIWLGAEPKTAALLAIKR